jgi:anti-anti-sigma factor
MRVDPEPFRVAVCPERDRVRVLLTGEVDLATVGTVEEQLRELLDAGFDQVVMDLRRLSFMDCSGVRMLIAVDRRARERGGRLGIVCATGQVRRLLALSGVDRHLELSARLAPTGSCRDHGAVT